MVYDFSHYLLALYILKLRFECTSISISYCCITS